MLALNDTTDANMSRKGSPSGNVTAIADTSGTVVERYDYDPYGKVSFFNGSWTSLSSSNYDQDVLFAGYRFDVESGLYHVRFRMYHPTLGRWLQRDPTGCEFRSHRVRRDFRAVRACPDEAAAYNWPACEVDCVGATV